MKKFILTTIIIIGVSTLIGVMYLTRNAQFGGRINETAKKEYAKSPQWDGKQFVNQIETTMDINLNSIPGLLKETFSGRAARAPKEQLPLLPFDRAAWDKDTSEFQFIWFGHSVGLMKMAGKNILIDPMFGSDASPVGPFRTPRYSDSTLQIIDQLPPLDAVVITHDHYDHLDLNSFKLLLGKVAHYCVPLGVKRHLLRWGVSESHITEFDWWQGTEIGAVQMTFVPSRHFSGRGPFDRAESLWGGWTFSTDNQRVYWSGDGGYGPHFKEIGERLGPFDWAFLECGQYNEKWHAIHMYPEESVQAAIDVRANTSIPIHWGAFTLALHNWKDPVQRFKEEANERNVKIAMPELGKVVRSKTTAASFWWEPLY